MTTTISVSGLTRRYRDHLALDHVSLDIEGPTIVGLLGRNGAGKTTLLRSIAGQEPVVDGRIRIFGQDPDEHDAVLRRMVLVREDQVFPDFKVKDAVRAASWSYPEWDGQLAETLLDDFQLPRNRAIKKLSRGMRSGLSIAIGLAARAEVTLFDEPYAGLDAVARDIFYNRLLADFAAHPRTFVLSTHLVDEAADLLERVVIIDHGRVTVDRPADELRGSATTVTGPVAAVEQFVADRPSWDRRQIASQATVVVEGLIDELDRVRARDLRVSLEPLTLQQVIVRATGQPTAEQKARVNA